LFPGRDPRAPIDLREHVSDRVVSSLVVVRKALTLSVASGHVSLLFLYAFTRLNYTVDSRYVFLQHVVENPIWLFLHGAAAVALIASVVLRRNQMQASGFSTGVMGSWGFLTLLWGMTTVRSVSLIGPVMALVVTATIYLLTTAWAIGPDPPRSKRRIEE
jgi:uncharacterized membrane protein